MMKVAITGDMGSGKSHCAALFASLGVPVFLTDVVSKKLMAENAAVKQELKDQISPDIYNGDGTVNRDVLQVMMFESDTQDHVRKIIGDVLYSHVKLEYDKFVEEHADAAYTLCESAILFECGWFDYFDYIIYVHAPEDVRIQRVIERSKLTPEQQKARMKNQLNPRLKMRASDAVISNYGTYDTVKQVDSIHDELSFMALAYQ